MQVNYGSISGQVVEYGYTGAYTGGAETFVDAAVALSAQSVFTADAVSNDLYPYELTSHGTAHPNSLAANAQFATTGVVEYGVVTEFDSAKIVFDFQAISDQQLWREDINALASDVVTVNATGDTTATGRLRWRTDTDSGEYDVTVNIDIVNYVDAAANISAQSTVSAAPGLTLQPETQFETQSAMTASAQMGGEVAAGTAISAQSTVTADPAVDQNVAAAFAGQSTLSAGIELITGAGVAFSAQSTATTDPALDATAATQVAATSEFTADPALTHAAGTALQATSSMTAAGESSASLEAGVSIVVQSTTTTQPAMDLPVVSAFTGALTLQAIPAMDLLTQAAYAFVSSATFDAVGAVQVERGYLEVYSVHIYPALSCYTKVEPR